MKTPSFRTARSVAAWLQAALLLGLPFVTVRNESAVRFDIPSLKLYFFGTVLWISEAYFLLLVFLLLLSGLMLVTMLYGRIWCGWACPQTVLSDVARYLERISTWFSRHGVLQGAASHGILFLFSIAVSASLLWYFVSPYDMISDVAARSLGPWTTWSWAVFSLLIYLDIAFIRQKFCSAVCPYARLQSVFIDERTLTIAFDRTRQDECLGCEACTRVCPSGMDIRQGLQVECINCADCIDACARQMEKRESKPLVGYYRGSESTAIGGKVRPRVIGLSVMIALLAVLFVHQVTRRMPVDLFVMRDEAKAYHQTGIKDRLMNAYQVAIENHTLRPASYWLTITGIKDAEVAGIRNPIVLPPNSRTTMNVYVFARRKSLTERITRLRFTLQADVSSELRIVQEAPFVYPERSDRGVEI